MIMIMARNTQIHKASEKKNNTKTEKKLIHSLAFH